MVEKFIKNFNLRIIANSGQCFRINEMNNNVFYVIHKDKFIRIDYLGNCIYRFYCNEKDFDKIYVDYFDLKNNYEKYTKICKKDDLFLKNCICNSNGLRILNQDKFEMIISFIISQRKSVKAIQTSIERMCKLCGKKIENKFGIYYAFPTATQILNAGFNGISSCGLGYRTSYIIDFCKDYVNGKYNLDSLDKLTDDDLINSLMQIKGVGLKVASCVALFAYHRMSICPKDVWINRVLEKEYNGEVPIEYKKYAGIIQQYWFNYARLNKEV